MLNLFCARHKGNENKENFVMFAIEKHIHQQFDMIIPYRLLF